MADFPAMPLWTDAYLADTGHLSEAEHGRYLLMLMQMWRSPGCRFPNDRAWLERRFRRDPCAFENEIQPLIDEFFSTDGNWITQKRLQREWRRLREGSKKQSVRAKSRWNKENTSSHGNAGAAMPYPQPQPQPQPQPESHNPPIDTPPQHFELVSDDTKPNGHAKPGRTAEPLSHGSETVDKPARRTRKQPSRALPDDWRPDVDHCRELGMSASEINREANAFVDYCKSTGKMYVDHIAAFRNWCRRYTSTRDRRPH